MQSLTIELEKIIAELVEFTSSTATKESISILKFGISRSISNNKPS
jgi:hypothetical protein